jgi:putative transposase
MRRPNPFRYFKTSPEIIRLAVMLYVRFPLSLRNVEDLLHERGIEISHETIRLWWNRFRPIFASRIRRRRTRRMRAFSNCQWHLDEVFVKINGEIHYLWRAVDHEGEALESFVTKTRDKKAGLKFLRITIRKHGQPEVIVTDKLRSHGAALKEIGAENPATRTRHAALSTDAKFKEIRRHPRLDLQSFQPGTTSLQPEQLQTGPISCPRRMAPALCVMNSDIPNAVDLNNLL